MLSIRTFKSLFDLIRAFPDEESCIKHLEHLRWAGDVRSPYGHLNKIYKCKDHKYKCKVSNKYFNVRTGTMFESSRVPLQKWFLAIYIISSHKKGLSSHQLSRDIEVTQKTAWFMLHRIRASMASSIFQERLSGVVEADETYVGGKNRNRHWDKKTKGVGGRFLSDKIPVFGMLERGGNLFARVLPDVKLSSIGPLVHGVLVHGSTLMTDDALLYRAFNKFYDHCIVDHSSGQYVDGDNYTNTLEGAWSWLKRMIIGIYHVMSKKYLQFYVNEFVFKYNSRKFNDGLRFNDLLDRSFNNRLSYKSLRNAA